MVFAAGPEPQVFKDKTGQLTVVRPQLSFFLWISTCREHSPPLLGVQEGLSPLPKQEVTTLSLSPA